MPRPKLGTVARTAAAYGALAPSMLSGVAIGALTRDRHAIAELGVNTWVDALFAFTGVHLDVVGEANLTAERPAVFLFNHRNNFDPYVAIKLVRHNWGSVAKKEIAGPLLPLMHWLTPNVAFIDRSDSTKAVEGLAPVTELLRGGVSIMVAPEGTRSRDGNLGPFKKGPFRMAMDASAPLVPIVIRNADEITDRNATLIKSGTVQVAVLPPVSVKGWTARNLAPKIESVRQQYIDTLEDWPASR
jgi:putative phosphoserine phosphatase / 1-acylglycerol-3-phosphate O-acyltransferase